MQLPPRSQSALTAWRLTSPQECLTACLVLSLSQLRTKKDILATAGCTTSSVILQELATPGQQVDRLQKTKYPWSGKTEPSAKRISKHSPPSTQESQQASSATKAWSLRKCKLGETSSRTLEKQSSHLPRAVGGRTSMAERRMAMAVASMQKELSDRAKAKGAKRHCYLECRLRVNRPIGNANCHRHSRRN